MNDQDIAREAADQCCNWLEPSDDPITSGEREKCAEIILAAITKAREQDLAFLRDLRARLVPALTSSSDHAIINDIYMFLEENEDEISIVEGPVP